MISRPYGIKGLNITVLKASYIYHKGTVVVLNIQSVCVKFW